MKERNETERERERQGKGREREKKTDIASVPVRKYWNSRGLRSFPAERHDLGYNKGVQDRNLRSPLGAKKIPPAVTAAVGKQIIFSLSMGPDRPWSPRSRTLSGQSNFR